MMSPRLTRLPMIDPQRADEPVALFGARIVLWLLADGCTATLSDRELELAEYAAAYASTARGYLEGTYNRLSALRHELAAAIRRRQTLAGDTIASVPGGVSPDTPNEGPMAKLRHPAGPLAPVGDVTTIETECGCGGIIGHAYPCAYNTVDRRELAERLAF